MARQIKLNSTEWCDMIFEGRNKTYGAYSLRKTSSKRHIWAFIAALVCVGTLVAVPSFLKAVQPAKPMTVYIDDERTLNLGSDTVKEEDKDIIPPEAATPPPPNIIDSQMFTPPAITADELVDEDKEMANQQELFESNKRISIQTVETGNTTGVDIEDVLKEQREIVNTPPEDDKKVHDVVEVMPQFPGGNAELMRYLSTNIKYPPAMAEIGIQGRVILRFVVGKDGSVSNIEILSPLHPMGDKEAVRVVKSMPKWIPGQQNGNRVAVYFTLPVLFRLQ